MPRSPAATPMTISLGPLALAADRLLAVALIWLFLAGGSLIAVRGDMRAATASWIAVIVGLLVARAAYVVRHADAYVPEPWSILAVWQGGFLPWAGIATAGVAIAVWLRRSRSTALLLGVLAGLAAVHAVAAPALEPAPRPLARGLMLTDMEGRAITLDTLRGKSMVINLWATWCPPCQRELPMLAEVAATSRVPILLVNQGQDSATVAAYLAERKVTGTHVFLDHSGRTGDAAGGLVLPTTLFVDAKGRIVRRHSGEISRAALADGLALIARR